MWEKKLHRCNFPFVISGGKKTQGEREFVWTDADTQAAERLTELKSQNQSRLAGGWFKAIKSLRGPRWKERQEGGKRLQCEAAGRPDFFFMLSATVQGFVETQRSRSDPIQAILIILKCGSLSAKKRRKHPTTSAQTCAASCCTVRVGTAPREMLCYAACTCNVWTRPYVRVHLVVRFPRTHTHTAAFGKEIKWQTAASI